MGHDAESAKLVELWFLFSLIWSLCASLDEDGQKRIDTFLRESDGTFPNKDTVYEYFVDVKNKSWQHFEVRLNTMQWKFNSTLPFYKLQIPTVDTVRYEIVISSLLASNTPVLITGPVGTGKTS